MWCGQSGYTLSFFLASPCRILVPWPRIEPMSPTVEAQIPNHWTTREVLSLLFWLPLYTLLNTTAAKVILWKPKSNHITILLRTFNCFPLPSLQGLQSTLWPQNLPLFPGSPNASHTSPLALHETHFQLSLFKAIPLGWTDLPPGIHMTFSLTLLRFLLHVTFSQNPSLNTSYK